MGAQDQRNTGAPGEIWDDVEGAGSETLDAAIDVETIELDDPDPDPHDPVVKMRGMLDGLAGQAGRIQIWRTKPTWCAGFLASIDVEEGDDVDLATIKRDWGGGTIKFRPQARGARGYQYIRGGITLNFTGPPMERGQALGPDGAPATMPAPALAPAYGAPVLPGARTGNQALDFMTNLFTGLEGRLGSIETRLAAPAVTADPLADVQRTIALAKAFGELKNMFGADQRVLEEADDDDDDDEEEEAGPPSMEELGMRLLEKKLMEDETVQAELGAKPAPAQPAPRAQPAQPPPRARPQPAPQAAPTQPAPRAAATQAAPQAAAPDAWTQPDPWSTQMEPGRADEREPLRVVEAELVDPAELEGGLDADEILERLEAMPKQDQHALLEKLGPRILEILGGMER